MGSRQIKYSLFWAVLLLFCASSVESAQKLTVKSAEREIQLIGYTRSRKTVSLSSEVSGKVLTVNYDIGQAVGKAPFLLVDTTFIDLEMEATQHALERLQVSREKVTSRIAFLEKEYQRVSSLFQKGSSTEQKRDASLEELDQARLERSLTDVEIASTRIRLKEQQERRSRHALHAPQGWIVTERRIEEGELVSAGTPVARVSDFQHLIVPLSVSDEELSALQGFPAEFDVLVAGHPAKASIHWINPRFEERTRKLETEVLIRNFKGDKRGGLLCKLSLRVRANGVRVPKAAVLNRYENPLVFLPPRGDSIQIFILGETNDHFLISKDPRLPPGTELVLPEKGPDSDQPPRP